MQRLAEQFFDRNAAVMAEALVDPRTDASDPLQSVQAALALLAQLFVLTKSDTSRLCAFCRTAPAVGVC
jgi:hypothetical protein